MHIKGFNVELLVDNKPLKEYVIPATNLEVPTTGRSFCYNKASEEIELFSFLNFAVVPTTPVNYVIKVSSERVSRRKPMLARVYVDGFDDSTSLRLITKSPAYKDGFKNKTRQRKHHFEFKHNNKATLAGTSKLSSKKSKKNNPEFGVIGSVSVYFYMARVLADSSVRIRKDTFDPTVPNLDAYNYSEIMTSFGSGVKYEQSKHLRKLAKPLVKFGNSPIAALHLHYRSCEWFIEKNIGGFNANNLTSKNSTELVSNSNSSNGVKVKSKNESTNSTILASDSSSFNDVKVLKVENESTNSGKLVSNSNSFKVIKMKSEKSTVSTKPVSNTNSFKVIKMKSENANKKVKVEDEPPIIREKKITIKEENAKIKVENNGNLRVVKQEKRDSQSQSSITLGKRKRKSVKYREIIEILDSDEEDHEIIYLD